MAEISKISLPSGNTYDLKDAVAREAIGEVALDIPDAVSQLTNDVGYMTTTDFNTKISYGTTLPTTGTTGQIFILLES